jgi:hypothetical protein
MLLEGEKPREAHGILVARAITWILQRILLMATSGRRPRRAESADVTGFAPWRIEPATCRATFLCLRNQINEIDTSINIL